MVRAEQYDLTWTDKKYEKYIHYFELLENMILALQEVSNAISYMCFERVEILMPLPKELCDMVISYGVNYLYDQEEHYIYYTKRTNYMENFLHYLHQTPTNRYYIHKRNAAKSIINNILKEVDNNKSEIEKKIPFLNVRINKEYKNRTIITKHCISYIVINYLDMSSFTDREDVYDEQTGIIMDMNELLYETEM